MTETTGSSKTELVDERWDSSMPEFVYEAFYSGAIGGSIVALIFLILDTIRAEPFFTPSLMGSVLFEGQSAAEISGVSLASAGLYTVVHFLSFLLLGTVVAFGARQAELHSKHPALIMIAIFLLLEVGFVALATTALPGVIARVGAGPIGFANALAALGIGLFISHTHWPSSDEEREETL